MFIKKTLSFLAIVSVALFWSSCSEEGATAAVEGGDSSASLSSSDSITDMTSSADFGGSSAAESGSIGSTMAARVVVSSSDLPECSEAETGLLYYLIDEASFQYCDGSDYQELDLQGATGSDGESCSIEDVDGVNTLVCPDGSESAINGASGSLAGCSLEEESGELLAICDERAYVLYVMDSYPVINVAPVISYMEPYYYYYSTYEAGDNIEMYVSVSDENPGDVLTYWWDTDADGVVDTEGSRYEDVSFDAPGTYEVLVRVEDQDGLFDEATYSLTISEPTPSVTLYANSSSYSAYADVGENVSLSLYTSDDVVEYEWDLDGDGTYESVGGETESVSFTTTGSHYVYVRVTNSYGNTSTDYVIITVAGASVVVYANGSSYTYYADVNEEISLNAVASSAVSEYEWDLDGNGSYETSGSDSARVSFSTTGYHYVYARITDAYGNTSADYVSIYVEMPVVLTPGLTVYTVGLGGQVATGGWWYGQGQKGDGTANTFSCSGNVYDGLTEQPADWGSECETANGQEVTFEIAKSADANGDIWGFALIGFDFNENPAGTPDNLKLTYDVSEETGICVTYTSPAATWVLVKTTDDMDGDAYGFRLMPATSQTQVCKTWAELTKQAWSSPWTFNPVKTTGVQFKVETAGTHTVSVSEVGFW
jgi:hypothetical protein